MTSSTPNAIVFDAVNAFSTTTVDLSDGSLTWATTICQAITDNNQQWQSFLRALALAGFEQWLNAGAFEVSCNYRSDQVPAEGVNMRVGNYRLCILPMGGLSAPQVAIPTSSVKGRATAQLTAHFYVLVEVQEEIDQVRIVSGLRRDQLLEYCQSERVDLATELEISIPLRYFQVTPEQILQYLNCLEPMPESPSTSISIGQRTDTLSIGIINTGQWLNNQLDEVSRQLAWVLLPPSLPAGSMRPAGNTVDSIVQELADQGTHLPLEAKGASGTIRVGEASCRLYTWVWPRQPLPTREWSLLIVLGPEAGAFLPAGIRLTISDQEQVIGEESLAHNSATSFLYTEIIGSWQEQFTVQVSLSHDDDHPTPLAFRFEQE